MPDTNKARPNDSDHPISPPGAATFLPRAFVSQAKMTTSQNQNVSNPNPETINLLDSVPNNALRAFSKYLSTSIVPSYLTANFFSLFFILL
tara:strand:- start:11504 stop:11776 length:273 start_codon:yes stop_codon:yes gene_type:complete